MIRRTAIVGLVTLASLILSAESNAQWWGYGPSGWGGWRGSSTVGGDVARGMGAFAASVGSYNRETAEAMAIDRQSRMELNEYLWRSEQVRRQQQYQKNVARRERKAEAAKEIEQRVLYNPTQGDVTSGRALNAILHQLNSPIVPDSLVESVGSGLTLTGEQVKLIPFQFASKGIVISAHRLAMEDGWPGSLLTESFEESREKYRKIVEYLRSLPEEEESKEIVLEQIEVALDVLEGMRTQARRELSGIEYAEAERYLKTHAGLLQMARQPDVAGVLRQAYEKEEVEFARGLQFMEVFNLQFGIADDPAEINLYVSTLYPMLVELRTRVANDLGNKFTQDVPENVGSQSPVKAFEKLPWEVVGQAPGAAPIPDDAEEVDNN